MFLIFIFGCVQQNVVDTNTRYNFDYCNQNVSDIAIGLSKEQREVSYIIENELREMNIPENIIAASIVNAVAESNLKPHAIGDNGNSIGAFQLNSKGLGHKLTSEERQNLYVSSNIIGIQILKNKKLLESDKNGLNIPSLSAMVAQHIMRPANIELRKKERKQIAREMFPDRI